MPVNTAPTSTPSMGFLNITRRLANVGLSASGLTESPMTDMPNMRSAKLKSTRPVVCRLSFCEKSMSTVPMRARIGEKVDGFSNHNMKLSPLRPVRLKSHEVMVVPMLAPMIMPTTCSRRIMPEFTKPTTITVVAELDCTTAVTPAPSAIAAKRLLVARSSVLSSIPPESCSKPPLMSCIPNRENESPATNVNTCVQISKFI